jgi:hypothetical protein
MPRTAPYLAISVRRQGPQRFTVFLNGEAVDAVKLSPVGLWECASFVEVRSFRHHDAAISAAVAEAIARWAQWPRSRENENPTTSI